MKKVKGTLLRCDPALKQYLLALKVQKPELFNNGAEIELDGEHIFIQQMTKEELLARLQPEIDFWIKSTTYDEQDVDEFDININPDSVIKMS